MKKTHKITRNVLTLLLAAAILSGSSAITVSAAARAACSHPFQRIVFCSETQENLVHAVSVYYENGEWAGFRDCHYSRICEWTQTVCADCNMIISISEKTYTEKHELNH